MKGVNFITDDWDEVLEKHICIDPGSGKKGFISAFKNDYELITIDIEKKFKPTIQADVCHLPLKENLQPDVLLASPPCTHFSVASGKFPKKGIQKPMDLWGNIPIPMVQMIRRPSSPRGSNKIRNAFKTAADRAQIPLDVSLAVKQGVES